MTLPRRLFARLPATRALFVSVGFCIGGLPATTHGQAPTAGAPDAAAVIEQYITALGGRDALKRVQTIELQTERDQFGTVTKVYRVEDVRTRRFYQRADSPDGLQETGFDGTRVWQKRAAFHGYLSDDEILVRTTRNPEPDIRDYRESRRTFGRLPDETVDGRKYVVLQGMQHQVTGGDVPVKYYFDAATHLLLRRSYGNVVQVVQTFDDYRNVDGVLIAFTRTLDQPNGKVVTHVVVERHNVPLSDSVFQYRDGAPPLPPPPAEPVRESGAASHASTQNAQPLSDSVRLATFEFVWRKVNETYWDSTFNGTDWKAIHERYRPLVMSTTESGPFHALLSRMVGELRVSHFHVRSPESVINERTTSAELAERPNAQPGIGVRLLDGRLLVTEVDSAGPAAHAGIRPGYVIERIDGKSPDELYIAWRTRSADFELPRLGRTFAAEEALRGRADRTVALDVIEEHGRRVLRTVKREQPPLGVARMFAFESKRLAPTVGYIKWTVFFNDAVERFRAALDSFRDTEALIVDLRGNPGGVGAMSRSIASTLFADSASLGEARFRHETQRYAFAGSGTKAYRGKVVILLDGHSGSTSEVFAAGLQDLGRAIVVGDTSAGAVLPSNAELLPTGGNFQHPVSDYHSANGAALEGRGVIPNIIARPTRESLLDGRDIELERALRYVTTGN